MEFKWQVNIYYFTGFFFFSLFVFGLFAQIAAPCSQRHETLKAWILVCVC